MNISKIGPEMYICKFQIITFTSKQLSFQMQTSPVIRKRVLFVKHAALSRKCPRREESISNYYSINASNNQAVHRIQQRNPKCKICQFSQTFPDQPEQLFSIKRTTKTNNTRHKNVFLKHYRQNSCKAIKHQIGGHSTTTWTA